ncbi:MAG TPA: prolyl oligopeptidase family serine peptidase [Tepidisphaeraceae bacterium]|nr:prolyl oligopeptidase family serine peptidase [Tepidisphaeraceae bacterium]
MKRMKMNWTYLLAAAALPLMGVMNVNAADSAPRTGQHAQTFDQEIRVKLDYLLYLPADYNKEADKKFPLILFLHGSGERGSDVNKVKVHGPPKMVEAHPDAEPAKDFIVVSPQCPTDGWWKADELNALLDDVMARYHVDGDRVYLTGLSMGGFGTWDMASKFPKRFAAIAPMCGGGNAGMVRHIKNLPIWVFHGAADHVVPVQRSDEMVEALKKAGADVKYTRYPGVDHDCWTRSYANPELYSWFLSHKRGEKPGAPGKN